MLKHVFYRIPNIEYILKMLSVEIPVSTITMTEFTTPTKKIRCACCNKKLGLLGFTCKCGGNYCAEHRMSDRHACSYDYRQETAKRLEEQLVKVVGDKINKI
jgi:predicted nucleic acid binding AN1-type Zn finger protein